MDIFSTGAYKYAFGAYILLFSIILSFATNLNYCHHIVWQHVYSYYSYCKKFQIQFYSKI